jgi:hypothetical protein
MTGFDFPGIGGRLLLTKKRGERRRRRGEGKGAEPLPEVLPRLTNPFLKAAAVHYDDAQSSNCSTMRGSLSTRKKNGKDRRKKCNGRIDPPLSFCSSLFITSTKTRTFKQGCERSRAGDAKSRRERATYGLGRCNGQRGRRARPSCRRHGGQNTGASQALIGAAADVITGNMAI